MENFAKVFSRVYAFVIDHDQPFDCHLDNQNFDIEFEMYITDLEDFFVLRSELKKEVREIDFDLSVRVDSSHLVHVTVDGEIKDIIMYDCHIIGSDCSDVPF